MLYLYTIYRYSIASTEHDKSFRAFLKLTVNIPYRDSVSTSVLSPETAFLLPICERDGKTLRPPTAEDKKAGLATTILGVSGKLLEPKPCQLVPWVRRWNDTEIVIVEVKYLLHINTSS